MNVNKTTTISQSVAQLTKSANLKEKIVTSVVLLLLVAILTLL